MSARTGGIPESGGHVRLVINKTDQDTCLPRGGIPEARSSQDTCLPHGGIPKLKAINVIKQIRIRVYRTEGFLSLVAMFGWL